MKNPSDKGFSLIELSVVLVIIGILVAISLSLGTSQIQISNISSTKSKLDRIEDAMIMYYKTNHALPCPAPSAADMSNSSSNFGQGSVILNTSGYNDATCPNVVGSYTIPSSSPASVIYYGVVPVRDLGISDDYMFDAWGNRLTYAVSKFCVDPNDWSSNNTYKCAQSATPTSEGNNITVLDAAGTARPTKAAYVIISHGKDGYGAYNRKGAANPTGTNAPAQEQANAKTYTSPADATFRDAFINDGTVVARYFDDIVRWKPAQLFDTDAAAATTSACDMVLNPIIKGYGTNNYYYPCSDKSPSTTISGTDNYFFGSGAGYSLTSGSNNIFMGYQSGYSNADGSYNVLLGKNAGYNTISGRSNIMVGLNAGKANTGSYNIIMGENAETTASSGRSNIIMGLNGGKGNTGSYNIIMGEDAGGTADGGYNIFMGQNTGTNTSGVLNIFMGFDSGHHTTSGNFNVFMGEAGEENTTGSQNIFIGGNSGYLNTDGNFNVFMGFNSGPGWTTSDNNVAIGHATGIDYTTPGSGGAYNTMLGSKAGSNFTGGTNNTFLGATSGCSSCSSLTNATAVGYGAVNDTSNSVVLGNSSVTTVTVNGDLNLPHTTTTVAPQSPGGAAGLPASPRGYVTVKINGTNRTIAYY